MLKLASLSLVVLFALASPVLAKNPTIKAPAKVCLTPEDFKAKAVASGVKFDRKLEGDALKKLMAKTDQSDADVNLAEMFDKDGGIVSIFITFKAGCAVGYGGFPTSQKSVILLDADDGKI